MHYKFSLEILNIFSIYLNTQKCYIISLMTSFMNNYMEPETIIKLGELK